jgi:ABC-2 type transport system permease protein
MAMTGVPTRRSRSVTDSAVITAVTLVAVQSTAWERMAGTLPLLVASPTRPLVVFLGRSVVVIPDALASSFGGLVLASLFFRLDLPLSGLLWALPLLLVCALLLGAFVVWAGTLLDLTSLRSGGRERLSGRALLWLVVTVTALLLLGMLGEAARLR